MTSTLEVVFKDGDVPTEARDDLVGLAGQVYEGLSEDEIHEIEQLALDRRRFSRRARFER